MQQFFKFISILILVAGCNAKDNKTNIELTQDMMDQISIKAQDYDSIRGKPGQLVPPDHTVAQGHTIEKYKNDMSASKNLENPLKGNFEAYVIEKGKAKYDIYCAVCHGATGKGDGSVAAKMLVPPRNLLTDAAFNYTDGHIYAVIRDGFGTMGGYSNQIFDAKDRWAVVNYVRMLQKQGGQ